MADKETEVEVTKITNKVLIQLKKALGMSAEDKFEAKRLAAAAAKATGRGATKAAKIGGTALVGGTKGLFSGIGNFFKQGWWVALFPFFKIMGWMFTGVKAILKLPFMLMLGKGLKGSGGFLLKGFKLLLRPLAFVLSIWNY